MDRQDETHTDGQDAAERFLTKVEVAERLRRSPAWVLAQARAGRIESHKMGKAVMFTEAAVEAYIAGTRRQLKVSDDAEVKFARPAKAHRFRGIRG